MATSCAIIRLLAAPLLLFLLLSKRSAAQTYGSYSCYDSNTSEIVEQGSFFDYAYSPFTHPADPNHYGGHYYNNMNCTYTMTAPTGMYIFIEFIVFLLDANDCSGDYVDLKFSDNSIRTICGQPTGYIYDVFTDNQAEFKFFSNSAVRYRGFSGYFASYLPSKKRGAPPSLSITEYRHQLSAHPKRRTAFGVTLFSQLIQEASEVNYARRSPKIAGLLEQAREALREEKAREANEVQRLSQALSIRESFSKDKLVFMRHFALTRDFTRSCGTSCAKVSADLRRYCMEKIGLL